MACVRRWRWLRVVSAMGLAAFAVSAQAQGWRTVDTRGVREPPALREAQHDVRVDGFDVEQVPQLSPGVPLVFTVFGTPGASASVQIEGAQQALALTEVQPGIYEGRYLVGGEDRIDAGSRATATLRRGAVAAHALLEEPLALGGTPRPAGPPPMAAVAAPPSAAAPAPAPCADCAVVESIRVVEAGAEPERFHTISGVIIGTLFGEQVALEHDRRVARALGALSGRAHERTTRGRTRYEVALRRPDGALHLRSFLDRPPDLRVGDTVHLDAPVLARAAAGP